MTRTTHAFCLYSLNVTRAALALLLLALVAPARAEPGDDIRGPDLGDCQNLQVPAGNKVAFHAYAEGVQIYRWNGTSWDFVAPEAELFASAEDDDPVAIHYAGPTWESASGSRGQRSPRRGFVSASACLTVAPTATPPSRS